MGFEALAAVGNTILDAATSDAAVQGAAAGVVGGGLGALAAPKSPKLPSVTPMPDQNAIEQARRRSALLQQQRSGRTSTILSQDDTSTTLG